MGGFLVDFLGSLYVVVNFFSQHKLISSNWKLISCIFLFLLFGKQNSSRESTCLSDGWVIYWFPVTGIFWSLKIRFFRFSKGPEQPAKSQTKQPPGEKDDCFIVGRGHDPAEALLSTDRFTSRRMLNFALLYTHLYVGTWSAGSWPRPTNA